MTVSGYLHALAVLPQENDPLVQKEQKDTWALTISLYLFGEMVAGDIHMKENATEAIGFLNKLYVSSSHDDEIQTNIVSGKSVVHDSISPKSLLCLAVCQESMCFCKGPRRKYSRILSFFTTQKTTDGPTLRPPPSQSEFGRLVKPPIDLDVLAMNHAGAGVSWNVQEQYRIYGGESHDYWRLGCDSLQSGSKVTNVLE